MIENLLLGFTISLSLKNLIYCFIGCTVGTIIGVLPGLGPATTIALLLTLTYKLDLTSAIIMLAGIWYGSMYGGTITSVLLKIPGEPSSVVTILEGYQMALKGKAGKALGIAAFGSFVAGTFGTIILCLLAPPLSSFAIMFGPPEYSALMIMGMMLVIYLGGRSTKKAILMGALGLAVSTIGMDVITATERFTFGSKTLVSGIDIAIIAMGLFGISEVLNMAGSAELRASRQAIPCPNKLRELLPNGEDWKISTLPIARGTLLGFTLGMIPGGGAIISSFASYAIEKKLSKNPIKFGEGAIEGVAGPESANNAASTGAFVPCLTLGIPTNAPMALLIGAFMIHGVIPGPFILEKQPEIFWGIVTSMYVGNVILLILNVPLIKCFVRIMEVPIPWLSPLLIIICTIGSFSINNNPMDILVLYFFGTIGYFMRKFDYEPAPLVLGCVLGQRMEKSIQQSLIMSQGSLSIFFDRPIARILFIAAIIMVFSPLLKNLLKHKGLVPALHRKV